MFAKVLKVFIDTLHQRNERITFSKGHLKHSEDSLSCEPSKDFSAVTSTKLKHFMSTTESSTQSTLYVEPV